MARSRRSAPGTKLAPYALSRVGGVAGKNEMNVKDLSADARGQTAKPHGMESTERQFREQATILLIMAELETINEGRNCLTEAAKGYELLADVIKFQQSFSSS